MFAFRFPGILHAFLSNFERDTAAHNLLIRNISLFIGICYRQDEYNWNEAFKLVAQKLPGLKNVCVTVNQGCCLGFERAFRDPAEGRNIFLKDILKLRALQLSSLELVVAESEETFTNWML